MIFLYFARFTNDFALMGILPILLISISLSMDSFTVAIANGLSQYKVKTSKALQIALSFTLFQSFFPYFGWLAGRTVENLIRDLDHWVALVLLLIIGVKMICDGFRNKKAKRADELKLSIIITQSIATSIDAFAIGITLALLGEPILIPVIVIGVTTFLFSFIGVQLGKVIGSRIGKPVSIIGGTILIGIGVKIFYEHMFL